MAYQQPRQRLEPFLGMTWGEITEQLQGNRRNQALALWQWGAPRFSSYGTAQAHYWERYGTAATFERIDKVRQWAGLAPYGEAS
jgi:hypothetical protein